MKSGANDVITKLPLESSSKVASFACSFGRGDIDRVDFAVRVNVENMTELYGISAARNTMSTVYVMVANEGINIGFG